MTDNEWHGACAVLQEMDRRVRTPYAQVNGMDRVFAEWVVLLAPLFEAEIARRGEGE